MILLEVAIKETFVKNKGKMAIKKLQMSFSEYTLAAKIYFPHSGDGKEILEWELHVKRWIGIIVKN